MAGERAGVLIRSDAGPGVLHELTGVIASHNGDIALVALTFGRTRFQVADASGRAGSHGGGKRGRENESGRKAPHKITERSRSRNIAADDPKRLAKRSLN